MTGDNGNIEGKRDVMNMGKKQAIVVIVFVLFIAINFIWYNGIVSSNIKSINSTNGEVVVNNVYIKEGSIIELKGEWLYYDSLFVDELDANDSQRTTERVQIPEYKKLKTTREYNRYGTYQLTLSGLNPNQGYGIYTRDQITAFRLYANHNVVLSNGIVGKSLDTYVPEWKPKSTVVYADNHGKLLLQMEISNYLYDDGLFWNPIRIGNPDKIFSYHSNKLIVDLILNIGFLFIGIMFLFLFFYFHQDKSVFYFAIFVLTMTIRMFFTNSRAVTHFFPDISWEVVVRMEYLTGYMLLPTIILFVLALVNYAKLKYVKSIGVMIGIIIGIYVFTADHILYTRFLNPYLYLTLVVLVSAIVIIFRFYYRNKFYETVLIISFCNFLIGLFQELFGTMTSWVPIAIFNSVIGVSIILLDYFNSYLKEQEVLAINAAVDPLTGLYNRQFLIQFSKTRFRDLLIKHSHYILFLDLDGFKLVNDKYGHDIGDEVLQIIGRRIRSCFNSGDYIFRYGGDEFVVIMNCNDLDKIKIIADKLITTINETIVVNDIYHQVGVSIGITSCHFTKRQDLEDYISISDKAMYNAKISGGNQYEVQ